MSGAAREGLLLVGHGTRQPAGNAGFLALAAAVAARLGPAVPVEPCFLEHAAPSVAAGVDRLVERGAARVAVVPLFLFAAGHLKRDLPRLLAEARVRHPGVAFTAGGPLWPDPALADLCADVLRRAGLKGGSVGAPSPASTAILVARGSSDPAAGADLASLAAEAAGRLGPGARVLHAFAGLTGPTLAEVLDSAAPNGHPVHVLPVLLFPGAVLDQIAAQVRERPGTALAAPAGLAAHPAFLGLVTARCAEALATRILS